LILKSAARPVYALVTLLPLCFVGTTTTTAGVRAIQELYLPMTRAPETATVGRINLLVTGTLLACVLLVLVGCVRRWFQILAARREASLA
jgi:carbon starvation protein